MFSRILTPKSTETYLEKIERLKLAFDGADAVVIGAGAGLSTSAGLTYAGERFEKHFGDFIEKYGIRDMYSGGFYPFPTPEEYWAWWSRHITINRYERAPRPVYDQLLKWAEGRNYFVLTTNVDHQFQLAGFDKKRLFYTQGDYGLWQCSRPCCQETYDNEAAVRQMVAQQRDMRVPSALLPRCPRCGEPMTMNLRTDGRFVEDEGWHRARDRYGNFLRQYGGGRTVFLELGVGGNTPGIIKYPFQRYALGNPDALYVCVNPQKTAVPEALSGRSVWVNEDAGTFLRDLSRPAVWAL